MLNSLFYAPFLDSKNGVSAFSKYYLLKNNFKGEILTNNIGFLIKNKNEFLKIQIIDLIKIIKKSNLIYISCWHNKYSLLLIFISWVFKKRIIFISHGTSLIGYSISIKEIIRTVIGLFYFFIILLFSLLIDEVVVVCPDIIVDRKRFLDLIVYNLLGLKISKINTLYFANYLNDESLIKKVAFINKPISLIGYYSDIKNQLAFLSAAISFPDETFIILGKMEGKYFRKCLNFIINNKITNVLMLDSEAISSFELIRSSRCVVSCSRSESFGLVLLEAKLLNIPVISSNTGIAKDIGAVLVNNPKELIYQLSALLNK